MLINRLALLMLLCTGLCIGQPPSPHPPHALSQPTRETYLKLASQVDDALHADVLNVWFPRSVDRARGLPLPLLARLAKLAQ